MSDGRTYWWAKDAAWWRREAVTELGEEFGPLGPAVVDWLACEAKAQGGPYGRTGAVKAGYKALARGIFASPDVPIRPVVSLAVELGLLDDFQEAGRTFTCRISGWEDEQVRALEVVKKRRQRADAKDESPAAEPNPAQDDVGHEGTEGDVSPSVPKSPPTEQNRTRTNTPPTPRRGERARDVSRSKEEQQAWAEQLIREHGGFPTPQLVGEAIAVASRLRSGRVQLTNQIVLTQLRRRVPSWPRTNPAEEATTA